MNIDLQSHNRSTAAIRANGIIAEEQIAAATTHVAANDNDPDPGFPPPMPPAASKAVRWNHHTLPAAA